MLLQVALFIAHFAVSRAENRSCEQDWEYYDGSCYFHEGNIKTFSAAQANCELKQANLVTVNNINEHKFLSVLMGRYGAWNGLNSLNDTEVFEWISGEKGNFTNWLPGQPNKRYHCIHMLQKGEHKWRTKACSSTLRSICEKKANSDKERVHVMEDPLILSVTTADPDTLVSSQSTELTLVVTPEMTPLPTSVPRPVMDRGKGDENKEGKPEGPNDINVLIPLLIILLLFLLIVVAVIVICCKRRAEKREKLLNGAKKSEIIWL